MQRRGQHLADIEVQFPYQRTQRPRMLFAFLSTPREPG